MSNMVSAALRKAQVEEEREKRDKVLEPIKVAASFVSPIVSKAIERRFGGKSNSDEVESKGKRFTKRERPNDPKFYTKSLSKFANYVDTIRTFRIKSGGFEVNAAGYACPEFGILALNWTPTLGGVNPISQSSLTQPIEYAMNELFAKVRAANAGFSNNITKATQMIYVLAVDSLVTHITQIKRTLRCVKTYVNTNRYSGKALAAASLGLTLTSVDDIVQHYADYCVRLNYIIEQFNASVNIPNLFSLIQSRATMANDVYVDSTSMNANFMLYKTDIMFKTNDDGDGLSYSTMAGNLDARLNAIEDALQRLLILEPFNIVNGDFLKAFGPEAMIQIPELFTTEEQEFIYSEEINDRINNTIVSPILPGLGVNTTTDGNTLYQGTPGKPYLSQTTSTGSIEVDNYKNYYLSRIPINTDRPLDSVTAEDIISMTRHTVLMYYDGSSGASAGSMTNNVSYYAVGAEVIHLLQVYRVTVSNTYTLVLSVENIDSSYLATGDGVYSVKNYARGLFEVFPIMFMGISLLPSSTGLSDTVYYFTNPGGLPCWFNVKGRNKFSIDNDTLENLHLIALTSEFGLYDVVDTGRDIVKKGKDKVK